jgi:hypothetical protein
MNLVNLLALKIFNPYLIFCFNRLNHIQLIIMMLAIKYMEYHKIQIQIILLLFYKMGIIVKNVVKDIQK